MKKKFIKKLTLKKKTISKLQDDDMRLVKGAYSFDTCGCDTDSCSIVVNCCGPTTEKDNNNINLDKGQG